MFWEVNGKAKEQLITRNFWSYHVGYNVCGALTIEMSGTTCWNEQPKTFIVSKKNEIKGIIIICVLSVLESISEMRNLKLSLRKKSCLKSITRNVLQLKMMFWELNLRPKRQLLNRNFWSYHVGYHVCRALTIEMSGTTCWNEKPKTFFASEKKWLRIIKIEF